MTCPYCHHWLSLCRCAVVDLSARDSIARIPRKSYDAYVCSEVPSINHKVISNDESSANRERGQRPALQGACPSLGQGLSGGSAGHAGEGGRALASDGDDGQRHVHHEHAVSGGEGSVAHRLDDKGRCCGRKPIDYKSWNLGAPHKFCSRCNRAYDRITGEQIGNWAHHKCKACGGWVAGRPEKACPDCSP